MIIVKCEGDIFMKEIGIEAFELFEKRHNTMLLQKYPSLKIQNVGILDNRHFNPNKNYLNFSFKDKKYNIHSPLHFLTLIPSKSKLEDSSLLQTISFLHFLNWACWFYPKLTTDYNNIESFPSKSVKIDSELMSKELAKMIMQLSPTQIISEEAYKHDAKKSLQKNTQLKPTKFLSICRFYARAWFEMNFGAENSVKYAYYVAHYIKDPHSEKCSVYRDTRDAKRGVENLFKTEEIKKFKKLMSYVVNNFSWTIEPTNNTKIFILQIPINNKIIYNKYYFSIELQRYTESDKSRSYTISISQRTPKIGDSKHHIFYKFAKLYYK